MEVPYRTDNLIGAPLEHYMGLLKEADPVEISERTGVPYADGKFTLEFLNEVRPITFPDFSDDCWDDKARILFGRFLLEGHKPGNYGSFVPYRELKWGETYNGPFTNRCINRMSGTYGWRPEVFKKACEGLGGVPFESSGIAYEFRFMPELYIRFILWEGDEEFPATAQILFSDNFDNAFSGEDRVYCCEQILGNMKRYH